MDNKRVRYIILNNEVGEYLSYKGSYSEVKFSPSIAKSVLYKSESGCKRSLKSVNKFDEYDLSIIPVELKIKRLR